MAALTRPDLPPGPGRDLVDALHDLHHRAGWPSLRDLGRSVGCSPTTVSAVFSFPRLPSWGILELLVEAMGGDVAEFRRLWLRAGTPAGPARSVGARIAGRRRELDAVRGHLESGTGLLLVTGEAGIGKTKLIDTASTTAEVFVARGAGLPLSSEVPFLPVTSLLRALHRELGLGDVLATCPAYVRGAIGSLLPELDTQDHQPQGLEASARPRLFSAVQTLLETLMAARRVAVVIDDLHWVDKDTLDLLEHLLVAGVGVPVLGAFRTEDPSVPDTVLTWATRLRRLPNVETLDLGPLSRAETAEQIGLLPALHPRTAQEIEHIYARSLGRPLFTEQLAADVQGPLPPLLDDALGERVARLPADAHQIVSTLAVADRGLPVHVLQAASGLAPDVLVASLRVLDQRRLLADNPANSHTQGHPESDGERVALRHPLLAEAVRRRLVPGEPAVLHRRLAHALSAGGEPAEVAAHWQAAGDPAEELEWRIRAARRAQERIAHAEEVRQWQRALELWADAGDLDRRGGLRHIDAEIALLDALELSGRTEQAWAAVQPLVERVEDLPAPVAAEVLCRSAHYGSLLAGGLAPIEQAARSVKLLETGPPSEGLLRALAQYARCQADLDHATEAWETGRHLIDVCRSLGDTNELRRALMLQATHLLDYGWSSEARELLDEAHRLVPSRPDPNGDAQLGMIETDLILKFGGSTSELVEAGREALAAADEWGLDTRWATLLRYNIALGLLRAGRVREAADIVDDLTQGPPAWDSTAMHALRVALDAVRGRPDEAAERLTATLMAAQASRHGTEMNAVLTESQLWSGRAAEAFHRLTQVLEADHEVDGDFFSPIMAGECQVLAVRAAADLAADQPRRRDQLRREVRDLLDRDDPTRIASQAQHAYRRARAAELSRLVDQPQPELWAAAATEWDRVTRPFEAAYCRWRGAQAALASGQTSLAQRLLRTAAPQAHDHVPLRTAIQRTASRVARPSAVPRTGPAD